MTDSDTDNDKLCKALAKYILERAIKEKFKHIRIWSINEMRFDEDLVCFKYTSSDDLHENRLIRYKRKKIALKDLHLKDIEKRFILHNLVGTCP